MENELNDLSAQSDQSAQCTRELLMKCMYMRVCSAYKPCAREYIRVVYHWCVRSFVHMLNLHATRSVHAEF